ncbi:MAG: four helix bundle protein [Dehalococcoidia bacterium]|nr:four helix bundle protein [Dehalococcoidia bacterium]
MTKGFEELRVWQLAHALALEVYRISDAFPIEEKYASTSQIRRAASSVAANIAEGYGRHSRAEYLHFLHYSRGSLMEAKSYLYLARDLGYLTATQAGTIMDAIRDLGVRLNNTISALSRPPTKHNEQLSNDDRKTIEPQ